MSEISVFIKKTSESVCSLSPPPLSLPLSLALPPSLSPSLSHALSLPCEDAKRRQQSGAQEDSSPLTPIVLVP